MKPYILLFAIYVSLVACQKTDPDDPQEDTQSVWSGENGLTIKSGASWFWQLKGELDTSYDVQVYDVDLFDTSADTIETLKSSGKIVICYLSAGSYEDWRDDVDDIATEAIGKELDGWEGERWFDVRHQDVKDLFTSRLKLAVTKGCQGVEPDNVDGYQNDSGFELTEADQLAFNRFMAEEAHARGLSIGLKNATDLVTSLVGVFDWSLVEQCAEYEECHRYTPFAEAGKAVFQAEYTDISDEACADAETNGFSVAFFPLDLDGQMDLCNES